MRNNPGCPQRLHDRSGKKQFKQQCGFAIFELVLVIMITTLIGIWGASTWMRQIDEAAAQATGVWLHAVKKAVDQMLKGQADVLTGIVDIGPDGSRYQDLRRPSVGELIEAGHLPKNFTLQPPLKYEIGIRVLPAQEGCRDHGCKLEALILAQPIGMKPEHAQDLNRIGKILMAMDGQGASVHPLVPLRIKGAQIDVSNPPLPDMPALMPGSIVTQSFYDSAVSTEFVRRNEKRHTELDTSVTVKGRLSAGEYLQIQGQASEFSACQPDGLVARAEDGELLVCNQGRWSAPGGRFGGAYILHGMYGCMNSGTEVAMINPLTGWCSCPRGYSPMQISSWQQYMDDYDRVHTFICLK